MHAGPPPRGARATRRFLVHLHRVCTFGIGVDACREAHVDVGSIPVSVYVQCFGVDAIMHHHPGPIQRGPTARLHPPAAHPFSEPPGQRAAQQKSQPPKDGARWGQKLRLRQPNTGPSDGRHPFRAPCQSAAGTLGIPLCSNLPTAVSSRDAHPE